MNGTGGICLLRHTCGGRRDIEPAEYADWLTVGGRNQVAANQDTEQHHIQRQMGQNRTDARKTTVAGQRFGRRRNKTPDHPDHHHDEQQRADTFMNFRCLVIPDIVIAQRDHP
ncbi:hypothetical protein D3C80_1636040 [compost metagenome]